MSIHGMPLMGIKICLYGLRINFVSKKETTELAENYGSVT